MFNEEWPLLTYSWGRTDAHINTIRAIFFSCLLFAWPLLVPPQNARDYRAESPFQKCLVSIREAKNTFKPLFPGFGITHDRHAESLPYTGPAIDTLLRQQWSIYRFCQHTQFIFLMRWDDLVRVNINKNTFCICLCQMHCCIPIFVLFFFEAKITKCWSHVLLVFSEYVISEHFQPDGKYA